MRQGRGWGVCGGWRRALALGGALLLVWAALPGAPAAARHQRRFPASPPHAVAHYLADFSNHVMINPHLESWKIVSEWNNATAWYYEVSYGCGPRCVGRAAVTATTHDAAPRHGGATRHRVLTSDAHCTRLLPVLPWPALCEETETESLIVGVAAGEGGGALLTERAAARCSPLATLLVRCADAAELVARRQMRLRALTAALNS